MTAARIWFAIMGPGDVFGEMALFDPLRPVRPTLWLSLRLAWLPSSTGPSSVHSSSIPLSPIRLLRLWLAACATLTRHWLTWSSPTFPAASLRRCWTWLTASAARNRRRARCSRADSGRAGTAGWRIPRDREQGSCQFVSRGWIPPGGTRGGHSGPARLRQRSR